MLKVKGILIKALNRMVREEYGKEGYYRVVKSIKRSMRDMFEKPITTQLYLMDFYENFLKATSEGTGMGLREVGRHKFKYVYDMLKPVFEKIFTTYEDAIINATKISNHLVEGLEWKAETVEKQRKYRLVVKSPYRINTYPAFWEATLGFIEALLEHLGAEEAGVEQTSIGYNEIEILITV